MYCLRVVLFVIWIGVAVPAASSALDGRFVLAGVLAGISMLVLGAEWAAGTIETRLARPNDTREGARATVIDDPDNLRRP